jgi:hypothetical protein
LDIGPLSNLAASWPKQVHNHQQNFESGVSDFEDGVGMDIYEAEFHQLIEEL